MGDIRASEHMFAYRIGRFKGLPRPASALGLLALLALLLGACGSVKQGITEGDTGATSGADADDLAVIEGWSSALSEGDVDAAAGYFATPSTAENGGLAVDIDSMADAVAFNESLPCGAEVVAADTEDDVTTVTFELSDRPGGDCGSGAGGQAATAFRIEDDEIVEWRRVAVPGGGEGVPAAPPSGDQV